LNRVGGTKGPFNKA